MNKISAKELLKLPTKELVIKIYMQLIKLNGKVSFHEKFIWTLIGLLITGLIGGAIAYFIF
ncbi:hypothetical protein ES705_11210 [subsurface metagenome]